MKSEEFKKLKELVKKDTFLDVKDPNLLEKLCDYNLFHSKVYHKYVTIFIFETKKLKKLKADVLKKHGELYHYYKFEHDYKLETKSEIDAYINNNDDYYNLVLKMNDQEIVCKFLEKTMENINNMKWNIKNYLEYRKFLSGE